MLAFVSLHFASAASGRRPDVVRPARRLFVVFVPFVVKAF